MQKREGTPAPQETQWYETLCMAVEKAIHRKVEEQAGFDFLADAVFARTHELISISTFKRLWGKVRNDYAPSARTTNTLAQFLGYPDFESFCQYQNAGDTPPSDPVLGEHIDVSKDLDIDDEITLYWAPDRVCHIRYTGNYQFVGSDFIDMQPLETPKVRNCS